MARRFWIEFEEEIGVELPLGMKLGCGITALDLPHSKSILERKVFLKGLPRIKSVIENVDIRNLDQNHVLPNMNSPDGIGIWFPIGYE